MNIIYTQWYMANFLPVGFCCPGLWPVPLVCLLTYQFTMLAPFHCCPFSLNYYGCAWIREHWHSTGQHSHRQLLPAHQLQAAGCSHSSQGVFERV